MFLGNQFQNCLSVDRIFPDWLFVLKEADFDLIFKLDFDERIILAVVGQLPMLQ